MINTIDNFKPQAVIVDAGSFPANVRASHWLDECSRVVCCDGAANRYMATGKPLWRIVGDCDSLAPEIKEKYGSIIRCVAEQESNDQTKAVRYLAAKGLRNVVILGATGLREDHTIGNISLLVDYLRHGIDVRAYTDYGVFIPVHDNIKFQSPIGSQVSIFNFGATLLRAEGLRYPLRDFDNWWQGTLNETTSETFEISANGYFLIFVNY